MKTLYHKMYFKSFRKKKKTLKLNEDEWSHEVITLSLVTENWKAFYQREINSIILRINFNTEASIHPN